ncbi:protein YIPF5-like [Tribolium madens]|uniref:protein YIPF5-like n=1 Tax=Tribolium madens TaxID=41895 RepID=UPI001CF724FF|nr:protein YIPF5-like [Tribolium madens]
MTEEMHFWNPQDQNYVPNYYETDYNQMPTQPGDFQPFTDYSGQIPTIPDVSKFYDPRNVDFEEEPPLLEELEIYPDRILQKMLAVLNPFHSHGLTDDADYLNKDPDLAGPIFFYLILAVCLFLSGNKAHFGYIYGISVLSCLMMYCLLSLMTAQSVFNVTTVASVLGYSLIPIVGLSVFGVFFSLKGLFGAILATLSVMWSSISASRLFVAISGDREQQPLFAYPCALVSAVYVLLVVF